MSFLKRTDEGMLHYEQLKISDYGNMYFKDPDSRKNIEKLIFSKGLAGLIEPNYEHKGYIEYIGNINKAKVFNPWNREEYADGICIPYSLMKKHNLGIFARSADSMILTLFGDEFVTILNISVDSLNNGILEKLKEVLEYQDIDSMIAFASPCLCTEHLCVYGSGEYVGKRLSMYEELGYGKHIYDGRLAMLTDYDEIIRKEAEKNNIKIERRVAIDLKGIVTEQLNKMGIKNIFLDERCTYEDQNLGSALRSRLNHEDIRKDNVVLLYID